VLLASMSQSCCSKLRSVAKARDWCILRLVDFSIVEVVLTVEVVRRRMTSVGVCDGHV
jgi:hypothetical protein